MKAFVSAAAVAVIGALSSVSYAPPAHAARACYLILQNCAPGHQDKCQDDYDNCVAHGGQPVASGMPLKNNED
ncbi:MAG: hypothetical protein GAK28_04553 [Luteibacter sp.]|uniref:hypothetical protein n=1 Tax=Luteibacter sp. TaxID=1886636 RepID=UPI00138173C8|nr:hypothetical protein [Luteibacter sp.]KAF1003672.1 MAG: hypothetical protein GAK28_04553 [Luteibacter sp.]